MAQRFPCLRTVTDSGSPGRVLRTLTKARPLLFSEKEPGISGGFVASQPQISSYANGICADAWAEKPSKSPMTGKQRRVTNAQQVVAHSLEFVAQPGRAPGIQSEIPTAMGHAFSTTEGFVGCLVLVSEQETRLVTVITLWAGSNRLELCSDSAKRLEKWLSPYVDRWLRTRTYASFVTAPNQFLSASSFAEPTAAQLQ